MEGLHKFAVLQINNMAKTNPIIQFLKPLLNRTLGNAVGRIEKHLAMISDINGFIDGEGILNEMIENVKTMQPFHLDNSILKGIEIGGGHISFEIPGLNKRIAFDAQDLEVLKEMIIQKQQNHEREGNLQVPEKQV